MTPNNSQIVYFNYSFAYFIDSYNLRKSVILFFITKNYLQDDFTQTNHRVLKFKIPKL
jgi:hypothetical protein